MLALSTATLAQPSATPSDDPEPGLEELLNRQAGMSEAETQAEKGYLNLDLSPDVDVSRVERVPGADQNQPNRTCEPTPQMTANLRRHNQPGDRAYRDIAVYLSTMKVIATKDCTCVAKIIPHETVTKFEDRLREELDVAVLEPKHTRDFYKEYERQVKVIDAMCGEY